MTSLHAGFQHFVANLSVNYAAKEYYVSPQPEILMLFQIEKLPL
jgi:hypothetical protein